MALNLSEVIELKKLVQTQFAIQLHFHDSCGGQSFSAEEPIRQEVKEFLRKYFGEKRYQVLFSEDGYQFRLE